MKSKNLIAIVGPDKIGKSSSIVCLFNTLKSMKNVEVRDILYPKVGKIRSDVVAIVNMKTDNKQDIVLGIISLGDVDKVVFDYINQLLEKKCDTIIFACHQNFMDNNTYTNYFKSKGYNYITTSSLHNNYSPRVAITHSDNKDYSHVGNVDLNSVFSENMIYLLNQLYK